MCVRRLSLPSSFCRSISVSEIHSLKHSHVDSRYDCPDPAKLSTRRMTWAWGVMQSTINAPQYHYHKDTTPIIIYDAAVASIQYCTPREDLPPKAACDDHESSMTMTQFVRPQYSISLSVETLHVAPFVEKKRKREKEYDNRVKRARFKGWEIRARRHSLISFSARRRRPTTMVAAAPP